MRVLTVGVALLMIVSCATVLVTPDPLDDINGILHPHHSVKVHKLLAVPLGELRPFVLAAFHSFNPLSPVLHSNSPRLLALVCVLLC